MAAIEMRNIVKQYPDGFRAVNDVTIDVADGEFLILVGPSGCGKSTLLRMIVGLEDISSGDMVIDDKRVNDLAPRDRNLAMVFQNYALYPHMSVYENIAFPLRLAKIPGAEIDRKVREASALLELDEHLDRKPGNLSGGQRQRVAMGRAIVRDADAFLFDEPLSNLDAKLRGQMRTEIARLQKRLGITTVYVTHDQIEATTLGHRVAVLRRGVLQQLATPHELYDNPANLFVAGFIGSPPINFLPARVEGDSLILPSFGEVPLPSGRTIRAQEHPVLMAGIRPEYFEDADALDPETLARGMVFTVTVDMVEWLGHETYLYVDYSPGEEVRHLLAELEKDLDGEVIRTQLVVALEGSTRIRQGSTVRIWVDTSKIMLFDPETGYNLTLDEENAGVVTGALPPRQEDQAHA